MRVRLVSTVVRVRRTLKEFWDSVSGVASKGTEPFIDRDSVARADAPPFYKYSGNSSDNCQDDGNLKSSLAAGGLLSCSDDRVTRLKNIIGGNKSCCDDNGQHNPRLGISRTDTQAVEKCLADVSKAEAKLEVVKAKQATETSLLSDIMGKYHGNENKFSSACGKGTLLALVETTADNKNEQLKKEALGEREKANWLLSLKHDIVRQVTPSKKNESTLESESEKFALLGLKFNRCSGASIEKPVSSLTGSSHPSPTGSGTHISMSPSEKKLLARQSENCVNGDNLVFDKALQKRPSTSGDAVALVGLIDCIRHIQPDGARDNSKVPGISLNNLAKEKGSGKPMTSFCESRSYNVSQNSGATLMNMNGESNREIRPQVVVNLAAHAHSMTSESGKDNRPGHEQKTLKEFWDSVSDVASKGTEPLIYRDSVAQADAPLVYKYSGNSSDNCQHDGNSKSSLAAGGLLSCSDDGVTRLENIIGGNKSCDVDNGQHNPRLGFSKTDTQAVEKCSADVSKAEAKLEVVKAKKAMKTSLLSDIMGKYQGNENKCSSACGKSTLLALVETTADNKNELLDKLAHGEIEKENWLLSLKHDIVGQIAPSKKNDSTLESESEDVTLLRLKFDRCSGASIEKPVSSLTGSCHPSPIGSGTHISMSPSEKKFVARQSENCVNRDNLVFDKASQKRPSTSGDVGRALGGLIDCIRHIQPDEARDNSKVPGISLNNLATEKGSGKPMKSFRESRSYNARQNSGAALTKMNGGSNREVRPQVVVNLAAHAHSKTTESGKYNRPAHEGNSQYSSISSSGQYQKKYPHGLIIRFLLDNKDHNWILTALAKHGSTSLRSLFRGEKFEDIFVQVTEMADLPAAKLAIDRLLKSRCIISYVESTSADGTDGRVSIPKNTTDLDFPRTLLKNPAKTVKIKGLTEYLALQQLKEALNFGPNSLTNLVPGSSNSFAYAKFKTSELAEKAIAKHTLTVAGKQLNILRVDSPKTTAVRLSNVSDDIYKLLYPVCLKLGAIRGTLRRTTDIVDVLFEVTELPNMLHILNSLNGKEVSGTKISAAPSPVIPPEIVELLWRQPEGRQHLASVIHHLVDQIGYSTSMDELKHKISQQLSSWH